MGDAEIRKERAGKKKRSAFCSLSLSDKRWLSLTSLGEFRSRQTKRACTVERGRGRGERCFLSQISDKKSQVRGHGNSHALARRADGWKAVGEPCGRVRDTREAWSRARAERSLFRWERKREVGISDSLGSSDFKGGFFISVSIFTCWNTVRDSLLSLSAPSSPLLRPLL